MSGSAAMSLREPVHRGDAVDHAFVHVDVDDLRPDLDLLQGHGEGRVVVLGLDQVAEARGAGDVGAFADVDEERVLEDVQRLESRQPGGHLDLGKHAPRLALDDLGDLGDVGRRRAAAAADDVHEAGLGELGEIARLPLRGLVVLAEGVGETGVRVAGHVGVRDPGHLGDVGPHLGSTEGAVQADRDGLGVPDGVPEGLGHLAGQGPAGGVGDGAGDDDRPATAGLLEQRLDREDRRLGVERVEDGLDEEQVGAAVDQRSCGGQVGVGELLVGDVAGGGVVDVGADRRGARGRAERAGDVAPAAGRGGDLVADRAGQPGGLVVELVGQLLHAVVAERHRVGVERVGLDDVGAGLEVLPVDAGDDVGLRDRQQVVVADQVGRPVGEPLAAVAGLVGPVPLDGRAHGAVEDHDPLPQQCGELLGRVRSPVPWVSAAMPHPFRHGRRPWRSAERGGPPGAVGPVATPLDTPNLNRRQPTRP